MIEYENVVAVTNRHLCYNDYFEQIKKIAYSGVKTIIVREKDLSESEYLKLFEGVLKACEDTKTGIECIPHFYEKAAEEFGTMSLHLPMTLLSGRHHENIKSGTQAQCVMHAVKLGTSVHSVMQAVEAKKLGASYITAGHVFATDCKKGLEPRGLDFLENVCRAVDIPVYAIGGINESNYRSALEKGADKVCMMSGMMRLGGTE
ncbi:MAG: thiamine phosphate synthase [Bacteroides sp.]